MYFEFFNGAHLIFMSICVVLAVIFFTLVAKFKQSDKWKERILQILAVSTFIVHLSVLWYLFIVKDGNFIIPFNFIWPLALCNVIAFFNVVIAFMKKDTKLFKFMATACAWLGIIGGVLSVLAGKSEAVSFDSVRSLTSHFLMFLTSTYIFIAGYSKIRVSNLIPVTAGLLFNGLLGVATNGIFALKGWATQNAMWLYDGLLSGVDATKGYYMFIYILVFVFVFAAIWEWLKIKDKDQRWYRKLSKWYKIKIKKEVALATSGESLEPKPETKNNVTNSEKEKESKKK